MPSTAGAKAATNSWPILATSSPAPPWEPAPVPEIQQPG
jgi:hypothetical protein